MPINHELRKQGFGGHDMSAICELNPFAGRLDVYNRLIYGTDFEGNIATRLGTYLERFVIQEFHDTTGLDVEIFDTTLQHSKNKWHIGTPDAFIIGRPDEFMEIKTTRSKFRHYWGDEGTDDIPKQVIIQVHHYMPLLDEYRGEIQKKCWVPVLFLGDPHEVVIFEVRRDFELIKILKKKGADFWKNHIKKQIPPEPSDADEMARSLKMRFPFNRNEIIWIAENGSEAEGIIKDLQLKKSEMKIIESQELNLKNELIEIIGDNSGIESEAGKVTYRRSKDRVNTNWKKVALELKATPGLIKKHSTTVKGSRSLRQTEYTVLDGEGCL